MAPVQSRFGLSNAIATQLDLYRIMALARQLDEAEADLSKRGEAFFHASCGGHEGLAALGPLLAGDDWLHLHYRDKALMLARGVPVETMVHNLVSNASSPSNGRQMNPFMGDRGLNILCQNVPVGNQALQAVGVASVLKEQAGGSIVLCTIGDGGTQQGEVLEAIAEAVRSELPVLFVVEDNGYAISTRTATRTFFSLPEWCDPASSFLGLPIHRWDGRDVARFTEAASGVIDAVRETRRPALAVIELERLASHTNADDERVYRSEAERTRAARRGDPVRILREKLLDLGVDRDTLESIEAEAAAEIASAVEAALHVGDPLPETSASAPLPSALVDPSREYRGESRRPEVTMVNAMREVLRQQLASDPRVTLYGQDIEDPKGDVFGLTRGLTADCPGRVTNAPLSESTIVGVSIGRALAGARPVAFIQFADFLPLALNQIMCELGSMYWRSVGTWTCPLVIMVACGGYRPGLGPFHAQTHEAILAHIPGIDVLMPSTAGDAAGLLRAAFASERPTLFLYPKTSLNDPDRATSPDIEDHWVPLGRAHRSRRGDDLTLVTWGSTVRACERAAAALAGAGFHIDLLDLRSISPWDSTSVCESVARTGRLVVVHEDSRTCGFGSEIIAMVTERLGGVVRAVRVTRPDTYIPYNFSNQMEILPSFRRIVESCAALLDLNVEWNTEDQTELDLIPVRALGSSPADESVTLVELRAQQGQSIAVNDPIACLECDKALFDLESPVAGIVERVMVEEGQTVRVGTPLLLVRAEVSTYQSRRLLCNDVGVPSFVARQSPGATNEPSRPTSTLARGLVGVSSISVVEGQRVVENAELAVRFPGVEPADIAARTGIETRRWIGGGQTALGMAVEACRDVLATESLNVKQIDMIICSTCTPQVVSPSMACMILNQLDAKAEAPAYDVSAACSGYLFALAAGYDFLRSRPDGRVLVVTTEAMSRLVDPDDFETVLLFGDAATATVLYGQEHAGRARAMLRRPAISARGDDSGALVVPPEGPDRYVRMNGRKVFSEAVRRMIEMLKRACAEAGCDVAELDWVVPHQANGRIIEAVQARLGSFTGHVVNEIRHRGNSSSSTLPHCLANLLVDGRKVGKIGLCAFGAGFTYGAAILEAPDTLSAPTNLGLASSNGQDTSGMFAE